MDKKILNKKISPNFSYREVFRSIFDPACLDLNLKYATDEQLKAAADYAENFLEPLRNRINSRYLMRNNVKQIGIKPTTWLRQKQYEIMKKRSGNSQHIYGHVADIFPTGIVSDTLYLEVFYFIVSEVFSQINQQGGVGILHPTIEKGKVVRRGFIHRDYRNTTAIWEY